MADFKNNSGTEIFTKNLVLETNEKNYHDLVDAVKKYTAALAKKVTTHQIRVLFGKAIKMTNAASLWKLEVDLAYMAGRNEGNYEFRDFAIMLSNLIRETNDDNLDKFKEFFKMLVAYHKYNEKFNANKF